MITYCEIGLVDGVSPCQLEATDTIEIDDELYNVCDYHKGVWS
jgi:hypothetical protein